MFKKLICLLLGHKHIPNYYDFYFTFEKADDPNRQLQISHRTCIRCSTLVTYVNTKREDTTLTSIAIKGNWKILPVSKHA